MIGWLLLAWFVLGWVLITELSYLPGNSLNAWLYDRLAPLYPRKTQLGAYVDADAQDRTLLAPLRELCRYRAQPVVLDVGCGSGRASLALVHQPWFTGRIIALDLSEAMLAQFRAARESLPEAERARIEIHRAGAAEFLTRAGPVDAILLLEVGEFIRGFPDLLRALLTRLSPGGVLVVTRPPFPYCLMFPFRAQAWRTLARLLRASGLERIETLDFRPRYAFVHAWRPFRLPDTSGVAAVRGSTRSPT